VLSQSHLLFVFFFFIFFFFFFFFYAALTTSYFHVGKAETRTRNPGYYRQRNLYPNFLPVVPLSEVVRDDDLLAEHVRSIVIKTEALNGRSVVLESLIWRTPMRPVRLHGFFWINYFLI
jgi:hypothetical protein